MASVCYKLVGITRGGVVEYTRKRPGAPTEGEMVEWGMRNQCAFVGRYYPTLKGWRVLDIRKAFKRQMGGRPQQFWTGYGRGRRTYPTDASMVMHTIALSSMHT